ncbi:Fe-S cluster assembly protein SufD [Rhodococcus sp. NPDC060086]|uniref:Fe-S cluster assembly protein SufD n=1 Tax=Rhodococcus sp. NPDC060086 TaxID=3347055 RepID=UPI0036487F34
MTAEAKNIPTAGEPAVGTAGESAVGTAGEPAARNGVQDAVRAENRTPAVNTQAVPAANKGEVFTSFDVNAFEIPGGRDEAWRFTPLRRLRGLHDGTAVADGNATIEIGDVEGVQIETVGRDDTRLGQGGVPFDRVAAQAYSSFETATVITVGREVEVAEPVIITATGPGEGHVAFGHLQVRLAPFAQVTVVLDQKGSGTYAENVEFVLGDSAQLRIVAIQDWADDAVHVAAHHARLGRDAVLRHFTVGLGGDLVRVSATTKYDGPGGDAELLGLYFADAGQHLEQRLLVDHSQPHCKSNVVYKGALQGDPDSGKPDARTVWIGDVLIRAEAEGTDTFELNRNLVLTDGARADSVPNLEIETGEIVGAGHASATGRFDDEQLFYLRARGIPEDQARRLVVRGFFHELLEKITVPEVRERLEAAVEAELAAVGV